MAVAKSPTKAIPSLPKDWELNELGDVIDFVGGAQPPASTFIRKQMNGYIRLIQIRDYKTNEYETYIPENLARKRCDKDDVMIGRYGPPIFQILKGIDGAYNVALMKAIPKGKLTKNYMWHFLRQNCLLDFVEGLSQRSSGQTGVELPALKKYPFPLPNREEQDRIANCLSDVDSMIESVEKLIAKKRDIKQATMQQLLTGKTRLPGFSGRWELKALGSIGEPLIGLTYKPTDVVNDGWLVLRSSNIQNMKLAFEDNVYVNCTVPERMIVRSGDILICVRNGSRELIGKCALISNNPPKTTFGAFMSVFRSEDPKFVFQQFQSDIIKKQIHEHLGATINQITNKSLASFKIPYPSDPQERSAISEILEDLDNEVNSLEEKLKKLKFVKQGMMEELLTGRIRLI